MGSARLLHPVTSHAGRLASIRCPGTVGAVQGLADLRKQADMMRIPLCGEKAAGRVALIDDEDYELVSQYNLFIWQKDQPGGRRSKGPYARTKFTQDGNRISVRMHNLIMGHAWVDHRNGNGLDNQKHNLRPATWILNGANRKPQVNSASRFKGVSWERRDSRWRARITAAGKTRNLGYFTAEEDAAHAYDAAAQTAWGEYARLNFPEARTTQ